MIAKLLAAFRKPETSRAMLAALAIGWGLSVLTQTVERMQAESDELTAGIEEKAAQLAQLDALLAERVAEATDEMPPRFARCPDCFALVLDLEEHQGSGYCTKKHAEYMNLLVGPRVTCEVCGQTMPDIAGQVAHHTAREHGAVTSEDWDAWAADREASA